MSIYYYTNKDNAIYRPETRLCNLMLISKCSCDYPRNFLKASWNPMELLMPNTNHLFVARSSTPPAPPRRFPFLPPFLVLLLLSFPPFPQLLRGTPLARVLSLFDGAAPLLPFLPFVFPLPFPFVPPFPLGFSGLGPCLNPCLGPCLDDSSRSIVPTLNPRTPFSPIFPTTFLSTIGGSGQPIASAYSLAMRTKPSVSRRRFLRNVLLKPRKA